MIFGCTRHSLNKFGSALVGTIILRSAICNHLYFHTSSEPPLFKGDSRDVKNKK